MIKAGLVFFVYIFHTSLAVWQCTQNSDCASLEGSICYQGACGCPVGQQPALGGTRCVDLAPYYTSLCVESHQCSRLLSTFECRQSDPTAQEGTCMCQPNHHYFLGRCWPTIPPGQPCSRNEECLSTIRDLFSLTCNGTCVCAEGYYQRQRGECRKIANAVGEGCVIDEDCQFPGGVCNEREFVCYDSNEATTPAIIARNNFLTSSNNIKKTVTRTFSSGNSSRNAFSSCLTTTCSEPFECFGGACVCPVGYYSSEDGSSCLAELGSPASDPSQCVGLLAEIIDGICTCPPNFFFDENMRDCIKVSRFLTDSCVSDRSCHTFGSAARCGPPQQWGLRTCQCISEEAVWDEDRQMCRLFAGIGESCEVDSDCLAGELEIQCLTNDQGQGVCACPEGYAEVDGLCLTTGLSLGDACQATPECTETPNTVCENGRCSCDSSGYQEVDGTCAPIIGGICVENSDCVIANTVCVSNNATGVSTCLCDFDFVEYDDSCWPAVSGFNSSCMVTAQCTQALGPSSVCRDETCVCEAGHHHRDGSCWPITGLFEACSRSSQCYLSEMSDRVVCRNSLCQCDFDYPYSEELNTCTSGAATGVYVSVFTVTTAIIYLLYLS